MHWKTQLKTRAKKLKTVHESTQKGNETKLALQKLTDVEKRALKLWKEDCEDKDIAMVSESIYIVCVSVGKCVSYLLVFSLSTFFFVSFFCPTGFL